MWEKLTGWLRFLWEAGEQTQNNTLSIEKLHANDERFLEYAKALAHENELLRQALQHERELRERDIIELKLELRLQISEELRRLPPGEK